MQLHELARLAMAAPLELISHKLCPYVQRAVIALTEKGVPFERVDIDLSNKPDWFRAISPLGKTPVLLVGDVPIFESAVILEYLEETQPKPLHPADPLRRAEHRGWIEYGSTILSDIAGFYAAPDEATFKAKTLQLELDAVFGPVFRYFDVFDDIADFGILADKPKLQHWRKALAARPSVRAAVSADYPALLRAFIERRNS
jgi:glutathione S-transferase